MAKGPGNWATPADLWRLHEAFGLTRSFTSLRLLAQAAQMRIRMWDSACRNVRTFRAKVSRLRSAIAAPSQLGPLRLWPDWFSRSFLLRLDDNHRNFTEKVCSTDKIEKEILGQLTTTATAAQRQRLRTQYQRVSYRKLLHHQAPPPQFRVRDKLERWNLGDPCRHSHNSFEFKRCTPAWTSERCLHNLQQLHELVPPRVIAAAFSTVWDRWTTHRRFQKRDLPSNRCRLGCGGLAEDSLEHYANCSMIRQVAARFLNLKACQVNLHMFMFCCPTVTTAEDLTMGALLVYATYTATNNQRHHGPLDTLHLYDAMVQWVREGARGHSGATSVLQTRWKQQTPPPQSSVTRRMRHRATPPQ